MHGWHDRVGGRLAGWLLMAAVVCGVLVPVGAQTAIPEEYASRSVTRIALLDLRTRPHPSPDDYLVAERLLALASTLQPEDTELVRGRIRAAWAAGDSDLVESLTQELLRLDPGDTVAQLRLASSRIGRIQTVEDRLAAYDRFLGPGGAGIDPSVRSRLALDAAMLQRETGNLTGYADRLALATQLDSSNKEAASLAWSSFGPMQETRVGRIELLLNLLMADPTDPNVYQQLAIELALAGAFEQAQRFHAIAFSLYGADGAPERVGLSIESVVIRWQVEGPEAVVASLNMELAIMRQQAANLIVQYEQARMPTDSLTQPEEIVLSSLFNHIRLVAALMAEDEETITQTLSDMTRMFEKSLARAGALAELSSPQERARQAAEIWGELSQQLIAIAWAGLQTEALDIWSRRAADMLGENSSPAMMLGAWRELRLGDPLKAEAMFRSVQDETPLNRVGLGLSLEANGKVDEAVEVYRALATEKPMSLSGVWSRDQHRKLTGIDPMATPERAAAARLGDGVPAWVDRMTRQPRTFMGLRAEMVESAVGATEPARVRLRLTNLSSIPLAVGGDRPINSRLLLVPRLQVGTVDEFSRALPEVIELDHRLRLMPAESIDVVVLPDAGVAGWFAEVGAIETVRERWRVLQGYQLDAGGVPEPGQLCLEAETGRLGRAPLLLRHVSPIELADALEAAGQAELPEVVAAIRARALLGPGAEYRLSADDLQRLAGIAAERYPRLPLVSRAMMLAVLPSAFLAPGMEAFDIAALAERDPMLVPVALVTRVREADDPVLLGWIESETDGIGAIARALRNRLQTPAPTFSRLEAATLRATDDVK